MLAYFTIDRFHDAIVVVLNNELGFEQSFQFNGADGDEYQYSKRRKTGEEKKHAGKEYADIDQAANPVTEVKMMETRNKQEV